MLPRLHTDYVKNLLDPSIIFLLSISHSAILKWLFFSLQTVHLIDDFLHLFHQRVQLLDRPKVGRGLQIGDALHEQVDHLLALRDQRVDGDGLPEHLLRILQALF